MTPEVTPGGVLGILTGVLVLIGGAFAAWRNKSKTHVAVTEDSSRIGWIGDLDARMRRMQTQMDEIVTRERDTHDMHQECLRVNQSLIDRAKRQEEELVRQGIEIGRLRKLLFAVRPELRDVFGNTTPGDL